MSKIKILLLGIALFFAWGAAAHSGKPRIYLIIDTDCAADDFRTLCMLLGNRDVEILGITTSEGALTPRQGERKVKALLNSLYHQGIPVAAGREVGASIPAWREMSEQICWGDTLQKDGPEKSATDLLVETMGREPQKITFVCLGPLTNVADLLEAKPGLAEKIDKIIWYNSGAQPMGDTNYRIDTLSAQKVMASGIKMQLVSAKEEDSVPVSMFYLMELGQLQTSPYAQKVVTAHVTPPLVSAVKDEHLKVWDELTVLSHFAPQLFTVDSLSPTIDWYYVDTKQQIRPIEEQLLAVFKGKENVEGKIFYHFPVAEEYYIRDLMPIIARTVNRYGASEWRAAVLTNELHGHLGIYATLGVKMGIRAREYFNVGVDDIVVTSYAGSKPPVSCLNDGLQVSTGGTVGHGLIHIASDEEVRPEATFAFKGRSVTLRLKPEYARQVQEDLKKGIALYGAGTEENWQYVRKLAIQYWQDWDRHEIFEIIS